MGRLASLQIASFEDRELNAARASRLATEDALQSAMKEATGSLLAALVAQPRALMNLVDAGGVAVVGSGEPVTCGDVPPPDVLREIARWLEERRDLRPFSSDSLGADFPPALAASAVASGLLTFALPDTRLMWFRPELVQTVNWGGDPAKPVDAAAGSRLRPRHSFALWKEEVRARSRKWTPSDLEAADELQRRAMEVDLHRRLLSEQRAVRARDEMLAVVSHDLGNPLSVILLEAAHLLRHLPESEDQRTRTLTESVELIRRSTTRMKALIADLLELERLGAKSFPLDVQPVESRDLLEEARTDAKPLADAKHISLVLDLIDPPKIHADPHRISQVLSNLLGNSIKFTPEGGTVTLRARSRDGVLSVTIEDTGRGIAPEHLAHIFDRYWRPRASQGEGTGLGLYIARGIVEAHGGRVSAESSPQGATFVFTLPVEPRED
jgi:light-regulated signal transduction histidine kinase (bacteriophytochrome)